MLHAQSRFFSAPEIHSVDKPVNVLLNRVAPEMPRIT
jgi:hypothetical protein